jgi:hypothetical protein
MHVSHDDDSLPLGAELLEREDFDDVDEDVEEELAVSLARRGASDSLLATFVGEEHVDALREKADERLDAEDTPPAETHAEPA